MVQITNTTVLSVFSLIRDAIVANTDLAVRFNLNNIFQYEPKHKAANSTSFPYFWINLPDTEQEKTVFDNNFTLREFEISAVLRVDYLARERVLGYCNAFLKAIEDFESTFEASGYYDVMVDLEGVDPSTVIENKEVVEAIFSITFHGQVTRT